MHALREGAQDEVGLQGQGILDGQRVGRPESRRAQFDFLVYVTAERDGRLHAQGL